MNPIQRYGPTAILILFAVIGLRSIPADQAPVVVPTGPQMIQAADAGVLSTNPAATNRINLQAAYDKLDANGGGSIVFGAGPPIYLDKGIIADSNLSIGFKGQGPGSSTLIVGAGSNGITSGIKRVLRVPSPGMPKTLTEDQFVDLSTLGLDGAVSGPGQRWGFYTRAHTNIAQQGGPWDLGRGDGYKSARVLTISLLLDFSKVTDAQWNQMSVWGMSIHGVPCPVGLAIIRGQFFGMIGTRATTDPFADLPVVSNYWLGKPAVPRGLCRFHAQIDLDAGKVLSWVDNIQQAVTAQNTPLKPGRSFNANRFAPCGFGALSENAATPSDWTGGPSDCGIYGARIGDKPLFVDGGAGIPISRSDAVVVNDSLFFDKTAPGTIATLPLSDRPSDVVSSRMISTAPSGVGFVLDKAHTNNMNTTNPGVVEGLTVRCLDPKYGSSICTAMDYNFKVQGCNLSGGAHAVGTYNLGAGYPKQIQDCVLVGADSPIQFYFVAQADIERIKLMGTYRDGIRLYRCDDTSIKSIFSPNYESPDTFLFASNSVVHVDRVNLDNETPGKGCQVAGFYLSLTGSVPFMFSDIANVNDAGAGPTESTIVLDDDRLATGVKGKLVTKGIRLWNPQAQKSVVRIVGTSSRWSLDIEQAYSLPIPWIEGPTVPPVTTQIPK